jgi:penicillin-binding protein 2
MFKKHSIPSQPWPAIWFGVVMVLFGWLVVIRLVDIQLRQGEKYRSLADQNRFFAQDIPPERGALLDRWGKPLTVNRRRYQLMAEPNALFSTTTFLDTSTALQLMATQSATVNYVLERRYPFGSALAHVVGYVGPVTADDLIKNPDVQQADLLGKAGLETALNEKLRGEHGALWYEINALGQKQRIIKQQPAQNSPTINTTLDGALSTQAATAMGAHKGAVVIFDVKTGAILSLISQPSFDPNMLQPVGTPSAEVARKQLVSGYLTDPNRVLFNRAIAGGYPPGSVFKLVTALAGLAEGSITPDTVVEDTGILQVGEFSYANWYYTQYGRTEGPVKLDKAIARSNDIYFYKAAEAIGPTKLAEWSRRFGLGSKVGLELAGETEGLVPDPEWKERHIGEKWYLGNTYHFGIGQGDLLVTPVQVAQVVQAIGNKGRLCKLHLLTDTTAECGELGLTDDQLQPVFAGMLGACSPGGTAFPFFPINQQAAQAAAATGIVETSDPWARLGAGEVACKTGTAEFGAASASGQRQTHGWFVMVTQLPAKLQTAGWPAQIGMVVLVESDETQPYAEGSREAAPVAKAVYDWILTGTVNPTVSSDSSATGE